MGDDSDIILNKARSYCAYQERCISETEDKLREWKADRDLAAKIIEQLIRENFLNEERFARSFASGKFRINRWGKTKIIHELERRKMPDRIIQAGLEEIDEEEYESTLMDLLLKKNREIRETDPYRRKQKLIAFGLQKGYHFGLVKEIVEVVMKK